MPAAAPVVHVITIQGRVAGKQTVTKLADSKIKTEFSYRENGRGPDIFEDITLDSNGQLASFTATGKSTFGAPIAETFSRKASQPLPRRCTSPWRAAWRRVPSRHARC
jgi:hypothetical protein